MRRREHVSEQSLSEIMDCENTASPFAPVGVVPKAVNAHVLELRVDRQPLFRPVMTTVFRFAPCLSAPAPQTVDEYEVNQGL